MNSLQIVALVIMAVFYVAYFGKMLIQHKKGVKTDQMAKGSSKSKNVLAVEILMKISAYSIVVVEILSIILHWSITDSSFAWIGLVLSFIGVFVFIVAMYTMRDSWRAGIPEKDETELVTKGIYKFSRNPAFLGFDLMYIGLLIAFFNYLHLIFVIFAVVMFHLQILQEEHFLISTFGESYVRYKKKTARYFIL